MTCTEMTCPHHGEANVDKATIRTLTEALYLALQGADTTTMRAAEGQR